MQSLGYLLQLSFVQQSCYKFKCYEDRYTSIIVSHHPEPRNTVFSVCTASTEQKSAKLLHPFRRSGGVVVMYVRLSFVRTFVFCNGCILECVCFKLCSQPTDHSPHSTSIHSSQMPSKQEAQVRFSICYLSYLGFKRTYAIFRHSSKMSSCLIEPVISELKKQLSRSTAKGLVSIEKFSRMKMTSAVSLFLSSLLE